MSGKLSVASSLCFSTTPHQNAFTRLICYLLIQSLLITMKQRLWFCFSESLLYPMHANNGLDETKLQVISCLNGSKSGTSVNELSILDPRWNLVTEVSLAGILRQCVCVKEASTSCIICCMIQFSPDFHRECWAGDWEANGEIGFLFEESYALIFPDYLLDSVSLS